MAIFENLSTLSGTPLAQDELRGTRGTGGERRLALWADPPVHGP